jgi:alkanesulfonate monooxygenase SsuD/methylene tetrahydromethanopterin reductase-like flavin-dependent oxidoreductase (luciferase family)
MFTEEQATVAGRHHSVSGAYNNPKPLRGDIPILVGGSGERKTLRMVAQYADGCNVSGDPERVEHLLGVLTGHCEKLGRDPGEITKTAMAAGPLEQILERAQRYREVGVEGLTVALPDAHDLAAVALAGRTLAPMFAPGR